MIDKENSLEEILAHVWGMIARGGSDAKHPYHFPVMATSGDHEIHQRTLVLRHTDIKKCQLICYSDLRTQKVADLRTNKNVSWLFYDHQNKEQVRAASYATLHHQDALCEALWKKIPPKKRGDYVGPYALGTKKEHYTNNLPEGFLQHPTEENTQVGWKNFCVIVSEVYSIDFLKLMQGGHLRCKFEWNRGGWSKYWMAP